jgi:GT2 family glycosyltransferase
MPMSDPPLGRPPEDPAGDESEALQRLRLAEADIESLQDVLLSQESLADRLTTALHASAQSQQELTRVQQELTQALRSAGWRGLARAGKRRAVRLLAARRPVADLSLQPVEPVADASASTAEEVAVDRYSLRGLDRAVRHGGRRGRRRALVAQVEEIGEPPLVSIVFPVYNTPEEFLRQAIDSVRAQLYTKWELCIADDCSTLPHVAKVLDEYAALDERILVHRRQANGHISACSNSAVARPAAAWLCLMDHDDVLAEHALAVARWRCRRPEAAILYSDEDHIEADGVQDHPYFKPDFDPLLILGQNYFSHLCMVRADLVEPGGWFREGYEGSQDWDLVLRVLEHVRPDQVVHVPRVLYHWRTTPESTASSVSAKPYVVEASRRVVQEHLDRIGVARTRHDGLGQQLQPDHVGAAAAPTQGERDHPPSLGPVPAPLYRECPGAHAVPARGDHPGRRRRVPASDAPVPERRVGAGSPSSRTRDDLATRPNATSRPRQASGDVLCFMNDDVEVLSASWLDEVVGMLSHPGIGCVGAKLLYPSSRSSTPASCWASGEPWGTRTGSSSTGSPYGYFGRLRLAQCPAAVSWACLAVRRRSFDEIGGFSEEHFTGVFGDVDFCLRLREAGWRTGWTPYAEMIHFELPEDGRGVDGANAIRFDRDIRYLQRRWGRSGSRTILPTIPISHSPTSRSRWPGPRGGPTPRRAAPVRCSRWSEDPRRLALPMARDEVPRARATLSTKARWSP